MLNRKGLGQQALAENALLARDRNDPEMAKLMTQLNTVRSRLAQMRNHPPATGIEAWRTEVRQLTRVERDLARRLARSSGRLPRADAWVDLDEVRQHLLPGTVLIDIGRFNRVDFAARRKHVRPGHYAAAVIPPAAQGNVVLVDLGPADAIETAIDGVRQMIEDTPEASSALEHEQKVNEAFRAVAQLVLRPLLPHIDTTKSWIISPDGALWLIPWSALPLADNQFAIESYQISYAVSGRDLTTRRPTYDVSAPILVADPDYALAPSQVQQQEQQLSAAQARGRRESIQRLPNTAREAKQIRPYLARYAKAEPEMYLDKRAVERVVKIARRPRVMVLSTHGHFRPLPEEMKGIGDPLENPLLRSGLLFAGADYSRDLITVAQEDGVLTGLEIVGSDLRGTELVVLSACQTGLGDIRIGQAVGGLRQAFQLAGAQTVIATLWSVPDAQSADLMIAFFQNLAAGHTMAAAMQKAQIQLIAEERQMGRSNPFYWAAYTLTGVPTPEAPPATPMPQHAALMPQDAAPDVSQPPSTLPPPPSEPPQTAAIPRPAQPSQVSVPEPTPPPSSQPGSSQASLDAAMVGTWEMVLPNTQGMLIWVLHIAENGTYTFRIEGPGNMPGHSGIFHAVDGSWSLQSQQGVPWADGGTYAFPQDSQGNTLALRGKLGEGFWKRRGEDAPQKSN